jgi:shikimate kinase
VGRLVARRLGWEFVDLDQRIEARAGRTIATLFRDEGEPAFRLLEREEARLATRELHCVIAAGGGAFAQPDTRALLQQAAVTVWLQAGLDTVSSRVREDGSRPLLANRDIMRRLLAERESSYRMADVAVEAVGSPDEVADRVVALVRGRKPKRTSGRP